MSNKMLIDASHPEETRVVVTRGDKVEEFDFESTHRKQLRGNIYLAKVTRVEPSLQAAFVDYGGNRHGFLAFSEIHPDYYQIPMADREALLAAEQEEDEEELEQPVPEKKTRKRRSRRGRKSAAQSDETSAENEDGKEEASSTSTADEQIEAAQESDQTAASQQGDEETSNADAPPPETPSAPDEGSPSADDTTSASTDDSAAKASEPEAETPSSQSDDSAPSSGSDSSDDDPDSGPDKTIAEAVGLDDDVKSEDDAPEPRKLDEEESSSDAEEVEAADADAEDDDSDVSNVQTVEDDEDDDDDDDDDDDETGEDDDDVESVGQEDALEEVPVRRAKRRVRTYKIQEVIKRRQIILVQVVKEERGNKGAALTTYLSLAGRYSVLMPNTGRGGGISRKITNPGDRKRMRDIVQDLSVPEGMGIILRTAGANRTKTEIKRDFEYLLRLWEQVRDLTLQSTAPTLVYEEGSLIKRSIRDLYSKEIGQIHVAGDEGYREAKDFMRMLTPSHAKVVQPYKEDRPIFSRYHVENQLDAMFSPQVSLPSGGYLVINQTEALVAIDVNSGRATREHNIEDTALQTNLESAQEVARQLRLRDLAGLVVIDFIDMEDKRNGRLVERKLKECLKLDRARIQVGRISHFGLLEMSRQRLRTGVLESSIETCATCGGTGFVRTPSSIALHILRSLEDHLLRGVTHDLTVRTMAHVALYILNQKRQHLIEIEQRFGLEISVEEGSLPDGEFFTLEKGEPRRPLETAPVITDFPEPPSEEATADTEDDEEGGRKKRRRRRRRRGGGEENAQTSDASSTQDSEEEQSASPSENGDEDEDGEPKKRRRRGRRGGRRSRRRSEGDTVEASDASSSGEATDGANVTKADEAPEASAGAEGSGQSESANEGSHTPAQGETVTIAADDVQSASDAHDASGNGETSSSDEETSAPSPAPQEEKSAHRPISVSPDVIEKTEPKAVTQGEASSQQTPEPEAEPVSEPEEDTRPKKRGWWQRRGFF